MYYIFISVVVIDLSLRCLNTGPDDRLVSFKLMSVYVYVFNKQLERGKKFQSCSS